MSFSALNLAPRFQAPALPRDQRGVIEQPEKVFADARTSCPMTGEEKQDAVRAIMSRQDLTNPQKMTMIHEIMMAGADAALDRGLRVSSTRVELRLSQGVAVETEHAFVTFVEICGGDYVFKIKRKSDDQEENATVPMTTYPISCLGFWLRIERCIRGENAVEVEFTGDGVTYMESGGMMLVKSAAKD